MSIPVQFTYASLPAGYCWDTPAGYWAALQELISASVDSGIGFNFGNDEPGVDDQDIPWIRTLADGSLDRLYSFNGQWVSPHPIPPSSSFRTIWVGSLADLKTVEGGADEAITETSGPFWVEDTDFSFRSPIGVGTNTIAYNGAAATSVAVGGTLGVEKIALGATEMPAHRHTITLRDNNTDTEPLPAAGDPGAAADPNGNTGYAGGDTPGSSGTTVAHDNMQPSIGVYFIKRTARKYYVHTP